MDERKRESWKIWNKRKQGTSSFLSTAIRKKTPFRSTKKEKKGPTRGMTRGALTKEKKKRAEITDSLGRGSRGVRHKKWGKKTMSM